jgi:hypothetical protein
MYSGVLQQKASELMGMDRKWAELGCSLLILSFGGLVNQDYHYWLGGSKLNR